LGGCHNAKVSSAYGTINYYPYFRLEPSAIIGVVLFGIGEILGCRKFMKTTVLRASVLLALMVSASAFAQVNVANQPPAKPASASPTNSVPSLTVGKPKSPAVATTTQSNSPTPVPAAEPRVLHHQRTYALSQPRSISHPTKKEQK